MIELNDILDVINELKGTNLILHRSMLAHPKFKIYKTFTYALHDSNKEPSKIKEVAYNEAVPEDKIIERWYEMDRKYLSELIPMLIDYFKHV